MNFKELPIPVGSPCNLRAVSVRTDRFTKQDRTRQNGTGRDGTGQEKTGRHETRPGRESSATKASFACNISRGAVVEGRVIVTGCCLQEKRSVKDIAN